MESINNGCLQDHLLDMIMTEHVQKVETYIFDWKKKYIKPQRFHTLG